MSNYIGYIDVFNKDFVAGWFLNKDDVQRTYEIEVYLNGELIITASSSVFRQDISRIYGNGRHGFHIQLPEFFDGTLEIRVKGVDFRFSGNNKKFFEGSEKNFSENVSGFIDGLLYADGLWNLQGWVYSTEGNQQNSAQSVFIQNGEFTIESIFFSRQDISSETNSFGFRFRKLTSDILLKLVIGEVGCWASFGEKKKVRLTLLRKMQTQVVSDVFERYIRKLDNESVSKVVSLLISEINKTSHPTLSKGVTEVQMQVGLLSYDRTASVGKNGILFLEGGSNSVRDLYKVEECTIIRDGWIKLIQERYDAVSRLGSQFFQVIVPEKQSILVNENPSGVRGETPLLRELGDYCKGFDFYIDVVDVFRNIYKNENKIPFLKTDSHISFYGVQALFESICSRMLRKEITLESSKLEKRTVISGDLANRFGYGYLVEEVDYPADSWGFGSTSVRLIKKIDPPSGHYGSLRIWENDAPRDFRTVLVFGSSTSERGENPLRLLWWMSRFFKKTIFVWSSTVDLEIIRRECPDFVIAQTVERFLRVVPPS